MEVNDMSKWICYWDDRDVEQEPFIIEAESYEEAEKKAYKQCDEMSYNFGYEVQEYEEEEEYE